MLNRLLPKRIDNAYRGRTAAVWLFTLVVLTRLGISLGSIFNGYNVATKADGIALDMFTPAGAQAVVSLFAIWGLAQLMICVLCAVVLVRYRAMIPFMFALLLLEHLSRKLILWAIPIAKTGIAPGVAVNLVLLGVTMLGLGLSLWDRESGRAKE